MEKITGVSPSKTTPEVSSGKKQNITFSRWVLVLIMLVAILTGGFYDNWRNNPERVVKNSIRKALAGQTFNANINGVTMLGNTMAGRHRLRQTFTSGGEMSVTVLEGSATGLPMNAYTALSSLRHASDLTEHGREAMYSHITRYFSGSIDDPELGDQVGQIFEYWIDYRTRMPVRLSITRFERQNVLNRNDTMSVGTYINIRFYGWSGE